MKFRPLGTTGLTVSEIGFGTWAIGGHSYGTVRDEDSLEALETAFEHGVNFFDTADMYGAGHSENLLAKFSQGKSRDKIIFATKGGHDFYHGAVKKDFSAKHLKFACEESLKRLNVSYIDLYQLHNPSLQILNQGEALEALVSLQKEGKIRFIGVSVLTEEEALQCLRDSRIQALQIVFNLLDQRMGVRVLAEALGKKVGLIAREPLARGILTEKYKAGHSFEKNDHRRGFPTEKLDLENQKIEKIRRVLPTQRLSLVRAALEYVLEYDAISCVIPGAKNKAQILENLLAVEDPRLRSQEASSLRDLYHREAIFREVIF